MEKFHPRKVLIVDDEIDMRVFLSAVVKASGHIPKAVREGDQGLKKAKEDPPDLIILDVMMPNQGGALTYLKLKSESELKDIPVVIVSAVPEKSFAHYLKMVCAGRDSPLPSPDAYLEKPILPQDLVSIIKRLL